MAFRLKHPTVLLATSLILFCGFAQVGLHGATIDSGVAAKPWGQEKAETDTHWRELENWLPHLTTTPVRRLGIGSVRFTVKAAAGNSAVFEIVPGPQTRPDAQVTVRWTGNPRMGPGSWGGQQRRRTPGVRRFSLSPAEYAAFSRQVDRSLATVLDLYLDDICSDTNEWLLERKTRNGITSMTELACGSDGPLNDIRRKLEQLSRQHGVPNLFSAR